MNCVRCVIRRWVFLWWKCRNWEKRSKIQMFPLKVWTVSKNSAFFVQHTNPDQNKLLRNWYIDVSTHLLTHRTHSNSAREEQRESYQPIHSIYLFIGSIWMSSFLIDCVLSIFTMSPFNYVTHTHFDTSLLPKTGTLHWLFVLGSNGKLNNINREPTFSSK